MSARIIEWSHDSGSLGRGVVAIGVFDGVHLGHAELLHTAHHHAADLGVDAIAVTFDRDPEQVVVPDKHVPQLLTLDEKLAYISKSGIDAILVVPFDVRIAQMPPEHFLEDVLLDTLEPAEVIVGEDFRFGQHARGDVGLLSEIGSARGFSTVPLALLHQGGKPITATRIRALIAAGDVADAAALLGRPHRVRGTVVHGRGDGTSTIGVPTANITPWTHAALPAEGVYAGHVTAAEQQFPAAVSVGLPPMFPDAIDFLEAHLIGFSGDLYGQEILVEFSARLRDQRTFDTQEELADAIRADVEQARTVLHQR